MLGGTSQIRVLSSMTTTLLAAVPAMVTPLVPGESTWKPVPVSVTS